MPVLRVFNPDGSLAEGARDHVFAAMLATDEAERVAFHAGMVVNTLYSDRAATITLPAATFALLYERGRAAIEAAIRERQIRGEQVGEAFLITMLLARENPTMASVGKGLRMHGWANARTQGLAASRSKLFERWGEMAPVAHLWGAYRRLIQRHGQGFELDVRELLALAELYREFGEAHRPPSGRTGTGRLNHTLLDAQRTWRVPAHARLPRIDDDLAWGWKPGRRWQEALAATPAR